MEEEENRCQALARKYDRARRMFGPADMDVHVMHGNKYEDKITIIETLCDELVDRIELLTIDHRAELGDVKVAEWKTKISHVEIITKDYVSKIR